MRALAVVSLCLLFVACDRESNSLDDFNARSITLPDGTVVKAEVMTHPTDMARGMMFRETFPEGRAMLFIHNAPGKYPYWMYQVKLPLDIVWLDKGRSVVEIVENAPPCKTKSSECAQHGGNRTAMYVVELPGGYARKHAVTEGAVLRF
jgi:uncharacterized protein